MNQKTGSAESSDESSEYDLLCETESFMSIAAVVKVTVVLHKVVYSFFSRSIPLLLKQQFFICNIT